jgi:hypothetical protein
MPLISLKDGRVIHSEHVVMYETFRNGDTRFLFPNGESVTGGAYSDIEELFIPVIKANPGFVAVFPIHLENGTFLYRQRSVIAWQRSGSGNYPMFEGYNRDHDQYAAVIDPDGGVFDSDGNMHDTLDAWKAEYEAENATVREAA